MKKVFITLISLLLITGLSACGNNAAQPNYLEADSDIVALVESPVQEEVADEPEESTPRPVLVSEERIEVEEELERYTVRQALYEGGEELVFHWDATLTMLVNHRKYNDGSETFEPLTGWGSPEVGILTIENSAGDIIQQIEHTNEWHSSIERSSSLHFADLNFDGYLDIYLKDVVGGNAIFALYYGYVWNPELRRFEITNFTEIINPWLDEENRLIRSRIRQWAAGHRFEIWRYIDGEFVMTNELETERGNPYSSHDDNHGALIFNYYITEDGNTRRILLERKLVDGEIVDVWPLISDTEEGRAIIYEHLFGEDSIWFPRRG